PVATLNVRPRHIPSAEYYAAPEHNLRSYPVYMPGPEPDGYWEMLRQVGPKPLIEPDLIRTEADWIKTRTKGLRRSDGGSTHDIRSAGDRKFQEQEVLGERTCLATD